MFSYFSNCVFVGLRPQCKPKFTKEMLTKLTLWRSGIICSLFCSLSLIIILFGIIIEKLLLSIIQKFFTTLFGLCSEQILNPTVPLPLSGILIRKHNLSFLHKLLLLDFNFQTSYNAIQTKNCRRPGTYLQQEGKTLWRDLEALR